jgi:hypothetical protein
MTEKSKASGMSQCLVCGFLKGGVVPLKPCTAKSGVHRFKEIESHMLASALGSKGGRPPVYKTEEERIAARRASYARQNAKRRGKAAAT